MSGSQEIRTQIASIQNTQKITKAMEMVAASKMKKAQDQMTKARPYADKILNVITHLAHAHPEYTSEFFAKRNVTKKGYIIVSSDRGLCGGLNNNLFKLVVENIETDSSSNIKPAFSLIGGKASSFFQRMGGDVIAQTAQLGDKPKIEQVLGLIKNTIDSFINKDIDNGSIFLGIRPEHVYFEKVNEDCFGIKLKSEIIEYTGHEQIITFNFSGQQFLGKFPSTIDIQMDKELGLYIDLKQISLFDKNTQNRI